MTTIRNPPGREIINITNKFKTMSYIILANSQQKPGEKVALVDRTKHQDHWWTESISNAIVFTKKEQADIQVAKLKFNHPQVFEYEKGKKRLGQVEVYKSRKSNFSRMLDEHEQLWHDDDWYEGMND